MINSQQINVLPQQVIEKIAAGEIIERPASVVKELLENSIDAGASFINITIEDAGFSLIKISDNGCGMDQNNIQKCLLPHSTSKIFKAEDLFSISTMGFRGEALASIAAVSRLTVVSNSTNESMGYSILSDGHGLSTVTPIQHTKGTTITCRDLFFNVPARKKFMKSRKAERIAITRILEQHVISFPSIHFTFKADGKRVFELPQVDTLPMRIAQLAGAEFTKKLICCSGETRDMSVNIYISDPQDAKARPRYQALYVNLRRVDNDSVTFAVYKAFSQFISASLKPSWFCFLDVDPSRVDINIHPTKQKIKFDDEKSLFSFIFKSVHDSVSKCLNVKSELTNTPIEDETHLANITNKESVENKPWTSSASAPLTENKESILKEKNTTINNYSSPQKTENDSEQIALSFMSVFNDKEFKSKETSEQKDDTFKITGKDWNLIPCYQIHKRFILAPIKNGILLIDQHAAHERVLYEEALEDLKRGQAESQRLLFPITFDLSSSEKDIVISNIEYFNSLGFDVQDFGGHTIAVSAMPTTGFMKTSDIENAIREFVTNLIEEKDKELLSHPQKRFAASFACGSAIKFGLELKQEEMNMLINNLFATKNPYICPHGRPTLIRISLEELTRRFLR